MTDSSLIDLTAPVQGTWCGCCSTPAGMASRSAMRRRAVAGEMGARFLSLSIVDLAHLCETAAEHAMADSSRPARYGWSSSATSNGR